MLDSTERRLLKLDAAFHEAVGNLHEKLETLLACSSFVFAQKPSVLPSAVVYLFSERGQPLYVGRSNGFRKRLGNHCRLSSRENQSVFAFKLAREMAGITEASYSGPNTRKALADDPDFRAGFDKAKVRLNAMDIRYVEETDQVRQALLEIYCAVALRTPYNEFGTH